MASVKTEKGQRVLNTRRRSVVIALVVGVAVVLLGLRYIGVFGGNVHAVVPGQFYRSAQLAGSTLGDVLAQDHIGTVVNLRGGTMNDEYYRSELAECQQHHAAHVDIPLNGRVLPTPSQLKALLATFDTAKYPVLIHCKAGADRTGLTSTLYLAVYKNVPLDTAESRELTWHYGHISWGDTHALNDFFDLYRKTCGTLNLRQWIVQRYPSVYQTAMHPSAGYRLADSPVRAH